MTPKEKPMNKLDLNKIEEKLNTSLENETCESLSNWIKEKRDTIMSTKEEQKQHLIDMMNRETLEEAAKELYPIEYTGRMFMPNRDEVNNLYKKEAFIEGAKWQQERSYSEEDLISFAHFYFQKEFNSTMQTSKSTDEIFKEWFEQFKKQ